MNKPCLFLLPLHMYVNIYRCVCNYVFTKGYVRITAIRLMHTGLTVASPMISVLSYIGDNSDFTTDRMTGCCCVPRVFAGCYFHLCQCVQVCYNYTFIFTV